MHNHVTFGYQHAHHMKSAHDVYEQGTGVCRDFAHLALTFCRCMGIPARYCTGYMGDIGIPPDPAPMDFSGWFEVYLSGQWYTFDARHNMPRIGRILMGTGRDAADVALTTSFGRMDLVEIPRHQRRGRGGVEHSACVRHCEERKRRSNPLLLSHCCMDCFASLAMTVRIPMTSDRLFVYGTLMRGFDHPMATAVVGRPRISSARRGAAAGFIA